MINPQIAREWPPHDGRPDEQEQSARFAKELVVPFRHTPYLGDPVVQPAAGRFASCGALQSGCDVVMYPDVKWPADDTLNTNLYTAFDFDGAKSSTVALETDDGTAITFGEMDRLSARLAHVVRSRGVGPGERVVMQVPKSPEMLLLYLAVVRVGGVIVPLNTGYTLAELGYLLRDAVPALIVCAPAVADSIRALLREQESPPLSKRSMVRPAARSCKPREARLHRSQMWTGRAMTWRQYSTPRALLDGRRVRC